MAHMGKLKGLAKAHIMSQKLHQEEFVPLKTITHVEQKKYVSTTFHVDLKLDNGGHIIAYDAKSLAQLGCVCQFRGTFLSNRYMWYQAVGLLGCQFGIALACTMMWTNPATIPIEIVSQCATVTEGIVSFLLSLFVTQVVSRWWTVRKDAVGALVNAVDGINMLVVVFHSTNSPYDMWLRRNVRRYLMAAHELVYIRAMTYERQSDGEGHFDPGDPDMQDDLTTLLDLEFLTPEECDDLRKWGNKAMCIWAWVGHLLSEYAQLPGEASKEAVKLVLDGRDATQTISTYVETPLPFSYIHIIVYIVRLANLILVLQAGMVTAKSIAEKSMNSVLVVTFQVLMVPAIYQGLLTMDRKLGNPLGTNMNDFPREHYREGLYKRAQDFAAAANSSPFQHPQAGRPNPPNPAGRLAHGDGYQGRLDPADSVKGINIGVNPGA